MIKVVFKKIGPHVLVKSSLWDKVTITVIIPHIGETLIYAAAVAFSYTEMKKC